ncbi:hypothetical protein HOE04_04280 [archaeon]|jgi:hypothetical protein|nr:hypothetical protein [archaeon]
MKQKDILIWSIILLTIATVAVYSITISKTDEGFAQCLTKEGVKFYGTYWCSHCANQKAMFGSSFENINYIECSLPERAGTTQECIDAGVQVYPTWGFADGTLVKGELTLQELSKRSNCELK